MQFLSKVFPTNNAQTLLPYVFSYLSFLICSTPPPLTKKILKCVKLVHICKTHLKSSWVLKHPDSLRSPHLPINLPIQIFAFTDRIRIQTASRIVHPTYAHTRDDRELFSLGNFACWKSIEYTYNNCLVIKHPHLRQLQLQQHKWLQRWTGN